MKSTTVIHTFPLSQEDCWALITNVVEYPTLIESYEALELETDGHEGLGARWKQTRTVFGRSHSQDIEVTEWKPPESVTHEAYEGGTHYRTSYRLIPNHDEGQTDVEVTFTVEATGFARLILAMFGQRLVDNTGAQVEKDLNDLLGSTREQ